MIDLDFLLEYRCLSNSYKRGLLSGREFYILLGNWRFAWRNVRCFS